MSVKEVSQLRKSGKLVEAFHMAFTELKQNPSDSWIQMSMFWVLRDLCQKIYIPQHEDSKLQKALDWMQKLLPTMMDDSGIGEKAYHSLMRSTLKHAHEISSASELSKTDAVRAYDSVCTILNNPSSVDESLHENLGWILYRYLKFVNAQPQSDDVPTLLQTYLALKNERPSLLHSSILNCALNFYKSHPSFEFYKFFMSWGSENLRSEDFMEAVIDGHTVPSFVARICRKLVEQSPIEVVESFLKVTYKQEAKVIDYIRESYYWSFYMMHKEGHTHQMYEAMGSYVSRFSQYGPSHWHSEILKQAERFMVDQDANRFIFFFRTWDINNLRAEDWREVTDEKGNTYKSLAAKSAKKCFDILKNQQTKNKELVEWLLSVYEIVITKDNDDWGMRNYALLHTWLGNLDKAISIYRELILSMSEKFYIWSELAACITDNVPLQTALLCKSLSVERDEKFLGDIHLHLAQLLILQHKEEEAHRELTIYRVNREKESWPLSALYKQLASQIGEAPATETTNQSFYKSMIPMADEFAFAELESRTFVLVDKFSKDGKTRCVFVDGNGISFQLNAHRFEGVNKARFGTAFDVKCIEDNIRLKPVVIRQKDGELWDLLPLQYGYISYVNTEKKIVTVLTPDSRTVLHSYSEKESYRKGDFLSFHPYFIEFKGEKKCRMAGIRRCKPADALEQFPSDLVVVDSVNSAKSLFHFVSDVDGVEGVVFFKETTLRPHEGQLLYIFYCFKMDKEHKRRCEPIKITCTDATSSDLVREVSGELRINSSYKGSYGFVDDCYVPGSLLKEATVFEGDEVSALAVYSGNDKWKVIKWL